MKINYKHDNILHNASAAEEIFPMLFDFYKPNSIIDIGCGTGSWLSVAKKMGISTIKGIDGIKVSDDLILINEDEFDLHDLTKPLNLNFKYDLAICLEVAEHLPFSAAENIIDILTVHSDVVLFSAAIPGQGGQNHINEQWPKYWMEKFKEKGYSPIDILRDKIWENEKIEWWYKQNILIYVKDNAVALNQKGKENDIRCIIHPELFNLKIAEINSLNAQISDTVWHPKIRKSLKLLIKAIVKKFF